MAKIIQKNTHSNNPPKKVSTPLSESSLGNITTYSANCNSQGFQKQEKTEAEVFALKHSFKKNKIELKKAIGKKVSRVSYCGIRSIGKQQPKHIIAVRGEKGGIFYRGMQRCGLVHFCPDCMYKIMKARAEELYKQLKAYRKKEKTTLFITFTIQHNASNRLADLYKTLQDAFNFANSSGSWKKEKQRLSIEYLKTAEVLLGDNGWHPHLHTVFVGDKDIVSGIEIFIDLYKKRLSKLGLVVNEHTVVVEKWNGQLDEMTEYMFKGKLEEELTSGGLKKTGKGKTFFELIEDKNDKAIDEYIKAIKGTHQYYMSRNFNQDIKAKTDEQIIKEDRVESVLFAIPIEAYNDIRAKGIALHLLNEYQYGGKERAVKLLELYDCETDFLLVEAVF